MAVPDTAWTIASGNVALTGAVPKTILGIVSSGTNMPNIVEMAVTFSGSTVASDPPCLVELVYGTNVSNWPGQNSSLVSANQLRGWPVTSSLSQIGSNWTQEPTVLTSVKQWYVPGGTGITLQYPLGREPTGISTPGISGKFVGIRVTCGVSNTQARAYLEFEE